MTKVARKKTMVKEERVVRTMRNMQKKKKKREKVMATKMKMTTTMMPMKMKKTKKKKKMLNHPRSSSGTILFNSKPGIILNSLLRRHPHRSLKQPPIFPV